MNEFCSVKDDLLENPLSALPNQPHSKEKNHANKSNKTATLMQGNVSYTLGKFHFKSDQETSRLKVAQQKTRGK